MDERRNETIEADQELMNELKNKFKQPTKVRLYIDEDGLYFYSERPLKLPFYDYVFNPLNFSKQETRFELMRREERRTMTVIRYQNLNNTSILELFWNAMQMLRRNANPAFEIYAHSINFNFGLRWFTLTQEPLEELMEIETKEQLENYLKRNIERFLKSTSTNGSDIFDSFHEIDPTVFILNIPKVVEGDLNGGAPVRKKNQQIVTLEDKFRCLTLKDSGNNCLISCFRIAKTIVKKKNKRIRYQLGVTDNEKLSLIHMDELEKIFDIGANVSLITNGELEVIRRTKYKNYFQIILYNKHYYYYDCEENKKEKPKLYLGLDYETTWDEFGHLQAYSYSAMLYTEQIQEYFEIGGDLAKKLANLLDKISEQYAEYKIIIVTYNGARFDNFILLNAVASLGWLRRRSLFYVKNSILKLEFKNFVTFDLIRYTVDSLAACLKSFNCNFNKLPFNHDEPQIARNEGRFDKWIEENAERVKKYNEVDVKGMMELFFKAKDAFEEIPRKLGLSTRIEDFMTISSFAYEIFSKIEKPNCEIVGKHEFIRKAMFGGRCQVNRPGKFEGKFHSMDCKSLYPFIMQWQDFPDGEYCETDFYVEGKLGIYNCLIKKQPPFNNVIPKREKDCPLDWFYRGEMECVLSSVDIETILRNGGDVEIRDGIYWEKKRPIFNKIIDIPEKIKTHQDKLAAEKSKDYNPALRNAMKLFMNSLSGKVGQNIYNEHTFIITSKNDRKEFDKLYDLISVTSVGGVEIVKGKKKNTRLRKIKPWYLGVFIYSYSRTHMYDAILRHIPNDWFNTDTDSAHMLAETLEKIPRFYGLEGGDKFGKFQLGGKFGDFEDELAGAKDINKAFYIKPKCYAYFNDCNSRKIRFKGIGRNDKILAINKTKNKLLRDTFEKEKRRQFECLSQIEKYNLYESLEPALGRDLFDLMLEEHQILILSSRIQRELKGLSQVYLIKTADRMF